MTIWKVLALIMLMLSWGLLSSLFYDKRKNTFDTPQGLIMLLAMAAMSVLAVHIAFYEL